LFGIPVPTVTPHLKNTRSGSSKIKEKKKVSLYRIQGFQTLLTLSD
jgi:hypothetical protein